MREQRTAVLFQLILICFVSLWCTFPECKLYSGYWRSPHTAIQACLKCIVVCRLECLWYLPVGNFSWFPVSCWLAAMSLATKALPFALLRTVNKYAHKRVVLPQQCMWWSQTVRAVCSELCQLGGFDCQIGGVIDTVPIHSSFIVTEVSSFCVRFEVLLFRLLSSGLWHCILSSSLLVR
jgi:hypothetical protein